MPRKYAKKRFNKKAAARRNGGGGRRRLIAQDAVIGAHGNLQGSAALDLALRKKAYRRARKAGERYGKSVPVDSATGAAGGHRVGKAKRMGTVIKKRRQDIQRILSDNRFPVIKSHGLLTTPQMDFTSGTQGIIEIPVGYVTTEIQDMLAQSQDAQYGMPQDTFGFVRPGVGSVINQKMDIYDKITKINMKNTSSHTIHCEIRAYVAKSFHSFSVGTSFANSMTTDNLVTSTTGITNVEEITTSIGKRPDMSLAHMNVRWGERKDARWLFSLEPGQETSYTYVQPGKRFDQAKYNVLQGSNSGTDILYHTGLSSQVLLFARAEIVCDSLDSDVTYGSGHMAINKEEWRSWAAVPYMKPNQTLAQNEWGTIVEANELDINQYQANNDPYEEGV